MELSAGRAAFSYLFCANGWNFATLNTHTQPHTDTQRWQQQSKQLAKVTRPRGACSRLRFLPHKQVYLFLPRRPIEAQPFAELSGAISEFASGQDMDFRFRPDSLALN